MTIIASPLNFLSCIIFLFLLSSCTTKINQEEEKEKIRTLIASMREAHFESDGEKFLEPMLDSFIEVRSGRYMKLFKVEASPGIQSYFDSMEFLELEDTQDPLIEISTDATLASYIGSIIVKGNLDGKPIFDKLSWQSTLRKINGKWKIIQNVNTILPDSRLGPVVMEQFKSRFADLSDSLYIFAKAKCTGPTDPFETLVLSSSSSGRMEQSSSDGHIILQHGDSGDWMLDVATEKLREELDPSIVGFVVGHEFHWLSLRPEDRFGEPVLDGISEFGGQKAFELSFKDPLEREVTFYYSFEDYIPLGFEYPSHSEGEMISSQFLDWTEVSGVPVFQRVIINENDTRWEYNFTEILLEDIGQAEFNKKDVILN